MEPQKRTITLTGRPPVRINEADWPVIAKATGDSYGPVSDYARHQQALAQNEVDGYAIRVRRHADGRAIVYAVVDAACSAWGEPAGGVDYRGGVLLGPEKPIAVAIAEVGDAAGIPGAVIRECVADLPPEEI